MPRAVPPAFQNQDTEKFLDHTNSLALPCVDKYCSLPSLWQLCLSWHPQFRAPLAWRLLLCTVSSRMSVCGVCLRLPAVVLCTFCPVLRHSP